MNMWITSDTHFGHNKEFIYKARGFNSLYDMEEYIIQDWNSKVQDDDIVYHLGDFALGMDEHRLNNIISRLKGTIYLVRGNHDTDNKLKFYRKKRKLSQIMNIKIFKEVRNNVNRSVNCEAANLNKTVAAANIQADDIEYIFAVREKKKRRKQWKKQNQPLYSPTEET